MTQRPLENLTPRQRQAYILRFRRGWRLRRIAAELGISVSSAGELVKRAQCRAGLGKEKVGVIPARQRLTRPLSLTDLEERGLPSA
jgi:FixJ family two-component response regulator